MKSNNASLCYDCEFATARHRGNSELCKDTDKRDTTSKKRNDNKGNALMVFSTRMLFTHQILFLTILFQVEP